MCGGHDDLLEDCLGVVRTAGVDSGSTCVGPGGATTGATRGATGFCGAASDTAVASATAARGAATRAAAADATGARATGVHATATDPAATVAAATDSAAANAAAARATAAHAAAAAADPAVRSGAADAREVGSGSAPRCPAAGFHARGATDDASAAAQQTVVPRHPPVPAATRPG